MVHFDNWKQAQYDLPLPCTIESIHLEALNLKTSTSSSHSKGKAMSHHTLNFGGFIMCMVSI